MSKHTFLRVSQAPVVFIVSQGSCQNDYNMGSRKSVPNSGR